MDASFAVVATQKSNTDASFSAVNVHLASVDASFGVIAIQKTNTDASFSAVNVHLASVDTSFGLVANQKVNTDASFALVKTNTDASFSAVNIHLASADNSLNLLAPKANPIFSGDASFDGNVYVTNDMTIHGRLNVQQYTNSSIINTTTTNYQFIVSEDMSLNGRLNVTGDASINGSLTVSQQLYANTASVGTNNTLVATTQFVHTAVDASFSDITAHNALTDASLANVALQKINTDASFSAVNSHLGLTDASFAAVATQKTNTDASFALVATQKTNTDASFSAVNTHLTSVDASFALVATQKTNTDASFSAVNTHLTSVDASFALVAVQKTNTDASFSAVNTHLTSVDASFAAVAVQKTNTDASFSVVNTHLTSVDASFALVAVQKTNTDASFSAVNTHLTSVDASFAAVAVQKTNTDASFSAVNAHFTLTDASFATVAVQKTNTDASFSAVNAHFALTDASLATVALQKTNTDASLNLLAPKASPTLSGLITMNGDVSFNGRLYFPANSISASSVSGAGSSAFTTTITTTADASLNGNVYVGGNVYANGNTLLTASTATITNDSWIHTNIIDSPPKVTFGTVQKTSTFIYIPWTYPTQMRIGMVSSFLPNLTGLYANYSVNAGTSYTSVITNGTSTNYISATPSNTNNTAITGIIFTNLAAPTGLPVPGLGYQSVTFPGESSARSVYVQYVSSSTFSATTANNVFAAYYINNNGGASNINTTTFDIYLSSYPPSAPQNIAISALNSGTTTMTDIGGSFSFNAPAYKDKTSLVLINDATSALSITNFDVSYAAISASKRYGGLITDSSHEFNFSSSTSGTSSNSGGAWTSTFSATGANSGTIKSLYPDASYVFYVSAKNSVAANYGDISSSTFSTGYLSPNVVAATTVSFTGATAYSAKKVSDGTSVSNLYATKTLTSNAVVSPVQYLATRGSGAAGQLTITAGLTLNGTTVDAGAAASLVYGGYGNLLSAGTNVTSTAGGIKLTAGNTTDSYNVSTSSPYNGFYQQASTTVALLSPATGSIYASNLPYTLSVTQAQNGNGSNVATYSFYYDDASTPAITAINSSIRTVATPVQISGINVIAGNIGLTVDTSVNYLGNYFYNSGTLISYSTGQTETGLANVTTAKTTTLVSPTGIRNNSSVVYTNPNTYATSIPCSVTAAYNAIGTSSASGLSSTAIPAILDYPSNVLNSSIPTTVPSISTSSTVGARVYSGVANGTTFVPPFLFDATTPYTSKIYNHTWSLVNNANTGGHDGTQELMIANGAFQTNNSAYAINYSSYLYGVGLSNTLNYSTLISSSATNYRFSTFSWAIPSGLTGTYNNVVLSIQNLANINSVNQVLYCTDNTTRMLLFYRIEDSSNLGTTSAVGTTTANSTNWISINEPGSTTLTTVGAGNYNTSDGALYKAAATPSQSGSALSAISTVAVSSASALTVSAGLPYSLTSIKYGAGNLKLYVRVGLPVKSGPATGPTMGSVGAYLA